MIWVGFVQSAFQTPFANVIEISPSNESIFKKIHEVWKGFFSQLESGTNRELLAQRV